MDVDMLLLKFFINAFLLYFILCWHNSKSEVILSQDYESVTDEWTIFGVNESTFSFSINVTYDRLYNFNLNTLRYAAVITRHGSRSPVASYPNDPYPFYDTEYWPDGPHQLTRYGKQQLYVTGQILRDRYNGFLNTNYIPSDISVRTNIYDRDFMSAACLLAGLYPPQGYQMWNPFILWQPIPIWEEPFDVATLGNVPTLCPRYYSERKRMIKEINSKGSQHRKLVEYVSYHTGRMIKYIDLIALTDTLNMQHENGFKLPEWTKLIYPEPLLNIYLMEFSLLMAGTSEMVRLAAGPLLEKINSQLLKKAEGKMVPNRQIYIEAAHDVTLLVLLKSFGFNSTFLIETSAFIVFELHENEEEYFVQVLYYNSSAKTEPNVLNLPVCPSPCNLNEFSDFVKSSAPVNWKEECQLLKQSTVDIPT